MVFWSFWTIVALCLFLVSLPKMPNTLVEWFAVLCFSFGCFACPWGMICLVHKALEDMLEAEDAANDKSEEASYH